MANTQAFSVYNLKYYSNGILRWENFYFTMLEWLPQSNSKNNKYSWINIFKFCLSQKQTAEKGFFLTWNFKSFVKACIESSVFCILFNRFSSWMKRSFCLWSRSSAMRVVSMSAVEVKLNARSISSICCL